MTAKWFEYERYRELATHFLLKNKKTPSAAVMRELCGGNGSLSTHQHLLVRWKNETDNDIVGLPAKAEAIIVRKARELFEEGWKALEEASRDENLRVQHEASEALQIAQDALSQAAKENEALLRRLEEFNSTLESASAQNQALIDKVNETEKFRFAAEEARRVLIDRLNELKENFTLEKKELEKRFEVRLQELRDKLIANETKHQEELNRREGQRESDKKEYENKLATQDIIKEELTSKLTQTISEVGFYQSKYQQSIRDLKLRNEEIFHLENDNQKLSQFLDENKTMRVKQTGQIEQLEKQLNETREKNSSLEYALKRQNSYVKMLEDNLNKFSDVQSEEVT